MLISKLEKLQQRVVFDLITKLLGSRKSMTEIQYNTIQIVIDYFTKYIYFLLYKKDSIVKNLMYIVNRHLLANYRVLKYIISDRAKVYISKYQKELLKVMRINYKTSIAYHLQTDEMIKQLNQSLEQYLKLYINKTQKN